MNERIREAITRLKAIPVHVEYIRVNGTSSIASQLALGKIVEDAHEAEELLESIPSPRPDTVI